MHLIGVRFFICLSVLNLFTYYCYLDRAGFISQAVELWLVDKAVLPIENSVGGSIHRNYDLLLRHRLHIVGEVQMQVIHCLLGLPGVRKEELQSVLSHPMVSHLGLLMCFGEYFLFLI
jgi:prephenate dehydratase